MPIKIFFKICGYKDSRFEAEAAFLSFKTATIVALELYTSNIHIVIIGNIVIYTRTFEMIP